MAAIGWHLTPLTSLQRSHRGELRSHPFPMYSSVHGEYTIYPNSTNHHVAIRVVARRVEAEV